MKILIIIFVVFISCEAICRDGLLTNVDKIAKNLLIHGVDRDNFTIKALKSISLARIRYPAMCDSCAVVMNYVISHRKKGVSKQSMVEYLQRLCYKFMDWSKVYCDGRIQNEIDTMLYILDLKNITAKRICSIQLLHMNCSDPDEVKWEISISEYKRIRPSGTFQENAKFVVGFSDIHYDPEYQADTDAICNEPVCCQHGYPKNVSHKAGYWGDHRNCELPWRTILEFVHVVSRQEDSPVTFCFAGDVVSQSSWKSTKERVITSLQSFYSLIRAISWKGLFFPVIGEYDTHPPGLFSPINITDRNVSTKWLFQLIADEWYNILNKNAEAYRTIRAGGYYTMEIHSQLQIIVLNTAVCLNQNLWLIYDDVDPYNQLQWLVQTLDKLQKETKRAYILQHVPMGYVHCHKQWSKQFARILQRYMFTIASVIYGHDHYASFKLFAHPTDQIQVLNGWGMGSLTAYGGRNPSYQIMPYRTITKILYHSNIYGVDILEANDKMWNRISQFNVQQRFIQNFKSLEYVSSFHNTIYTFKNKFKHWDEKYYRWYVSNFRNPKECNYRCKKILLCMSLSITTEESIRCQYYFQ